MDATELPSVTIVPTRRQSACQLRLSLILAFVAIAIPCGWLAAKVRQARSQQQAVDAILNHKGCCVYYERPGWVVIKGSGNTAGDSSDCRLLEGRINCDPHGCPWGLETGDPKSWAETLFGKSFARRAITVEVPFDRVGEVVQHLKQLPYLRSVLVLPSTFENNQEKQVADAVKRIERAVPGADAFAVEYDFNIKEEIEKSSVSLAK
jgi:hypothetical protein